MVRFESSKIGMTVDSGAARSGTAQFSCTSTRSPFAPGDRYTCADELLRLRNSSSPTLRSSPFLALVPLLLLLLFLYLFLLLHLLLLLVRFDPVIRCAFYRRCRGDSSHVVHSA